jgi:uncharacterized repeat protein (TIGR03847 family)
VTSHDEPSTFTAGAIGPPGQRVFFLQAQYDDATVAVKLEKQQVLALAEYLGGLLHDLPPPTDVPPAPELVEPIEPDWTVGTIGVAYDNDRDRIVIVAEELVAEDEDPGDVLRVAITRAQVRALIERAEELMMGGRPPCRLCGAPMDPSGHPCPRAN